MYLTVETPIPFTLKTWETSLENDIDEPNPGTNIVGFETELPAGQSFHFKVIISENRQ